MKDIKFIFELTKRDCSVSKSIYERIFSINVDSNSIEKTQIGISEGLVTILDVYGIGKFNGEIYGVELLLNRLEEVKNGKTDFFWYSDNPDMSQHGILFLTYKKGEEKLILEKVNDSNLCKNLEMGKYEINFIDFQNLLIDFKKFIFDVNSSLKL